MYVRLFFVLCFVSLFSLQAGCLQVCKDSSECEATYVCKNNRCQLPVCVSHRQCSNWFDSKPRLIKGPVCNYEDSTCVVCIDGFGCNPGERCFKEQCRENCPYIVNDDCAQCVEDSHCKTCQNCTNNQCVDRYNETYRVEVEPAPGAFILGDRCLRLTPKACNPIHKGSDALISKDGYRVPLLHFSYGSDKRAGLACPASLLKPDTEYSLERLEVVEKRTKRQPYMQNGSPISYTSKPISSFRKEMPSGFGNALKISQFFLQASQLVPKFHVLGVLEVVPIPIMFQVLEKEKGEKGSIKVMLTYGLAKSGTGGFEGKDRLDTTRFPVAVVFKGIFQGRWFRIQADEFSYIQKRNCRKKFGICYEIWKLANVVVTGYINPDAGYIENGTLYCKAIDQWCPYETECLLGMFPAHIFGAFKGIKNAMDDALFVVSPRAYEFVTTRVSEIKFVSNVPLKQESLKAKFFVCIGNVNSVSACDPLMAKPKSIEVKGTFSLSKSGVEGSFQLEEKDTFSPMRWYRIQITGETIYGKKVDTIFPFKYDGPR